MRASGRAKLLGGAVGAGLMLAVGVVLLLTGVLAMGSASSQTPAQNLAGAERDLPVSDLYSRLSPGVVFVQARVARQSQSPFAPPQPRQGVATGSGFVIDEAGFIVTNAHVVAGARNVAVRFNEQDDLVRAQLVGADLSTDLALLRVESVDVDLRPLELGDSERLRVGQPVAAIGNPFGFEDTVTTGIVSALQRQISAPNEFTIDDVIQTDASINPGNSGGPLLDAAGRVVGINSQIASPAGGSVGVGFAVPVNIAKRVIPDLKDDGKVEWAFLGVTTAPVTEEIAQALDLPVPEGALVQSVAEGGPADEAGLEAGTRRAPQGLVAGGNLIVGLDGKKIASPQDLASAVADHRPGERVSVEFFRDGERRTASVELGRRPTPSAEEESRGPDEGLPFPFP